MPEIVDPTPTPKSEWQSNRLARIGVRVLRTYIQTVLGLISVTSLGNVIPGNPIPPPADAAAVLYISFYGACFPALVSLLQNAYEELQHIDPGTATRG